MSRYKVVMFDHAFALGVFDRYADAVDYARTLNGISESAGLPQTAKIVAFEPAVSSSQGEDAPS